MMHKICIFIALFSLFFSARLFADLGPCEISKLTASDGALKDYFGYSASLSGDYALIGSNYDDDAGLDSGSAYIFRRKGMAWIEEAKLIASDGVTHDGFGWSVSLNDDYALIGAIYDDDAGLDSGSAYIFRREGTVWIEEAKLTASDGALWDYFGYSVSLSGNYALVGAKYDDNAGNDSGSAYIFRRAGTSWIEESKLTASDAATWDSFGCSVSLNGDCAFIGALYDDDAGDTSGSAYIFRRAGTEWTEEAKLTASDGTAHAQFGSSVSYSGDYALIGARYEDDAGIDSGSAYIFRRAGTVWTEEAKLTASDGAANELFGWSVSLSGDYALVGAFLDDDAGSNSGSAYIFGLSSAACGSRILAGPGPDYSNPPHVRIFPPEQDAVHEYEFSAYGPWHYGVHVTCGDVTGNNQDEIITGAGPGAVYGPHVRGFKTDSTTIPGLNFMAYGTLKFGVNVAASDIDRDGYDEIITGAGPGAVFGPHVRAFDYDGTPSIAPVPGVSFMAYNTRRWGVHVTGGDIDGDGFDEIVTGPGPGVVFGPHVRGWDVDDGPVTAMYGVSFLAYGTRKYGCVVSSGDVDGDGFDEMITAPGPSALFASHIGGWNYDGISVSPLPGYSFLAWPSSETRYGARIFAGADLNVDGKDELVVGAGPDPSIASTVKVFRYEGFGVIELFSLHAFPSSWTHGVNVAAGRF